MNAYTPVTIPARADLLLLDVARRLQLPPSKNADAEKWYRALCAHVDRVGSPLEGKVLNCYAGGSFATGTVVASKVSKNQHDLDVVLEIDFAPYTLPSTMLTLLFKAINGELDSRYHGKVRLNSRCVTVTYECGTTVDLMPIARLPNQGEKAGNLFHWKGETEFHKPVNPWGFADHFNTAVSFDPAFAQLFEARRRAASGLIVEAATEPLPEQTPLAEKSPRVVALQLLKRFRDLRYRPRNGRKPPSIVLAALALELPAAGSSLLGEVIQLSDHVNARLRTCISRRTLLEIRNPAFTPDVFTDRWPEDMRAQEVFAADLRYFKVQLSLLKNDELSFTEMKIILDDLFGETAAKSAIEAMLTADHGEAEKGGMRFGSRGRVLTGLAAAAGVASSISARASTNMGGQWPSD
jgi:hypothetical protein